MAIHQEVLRVANEIARGRADRSFSPEEVVRALPHLNQNSVRTHVVSRCCENAPKNHAHKWNYFKRVGRGRYQVDPAYCKEGVVEKTKIKAAKRKRPENDALRQTIHCVVHVEAGTYVAECLEFGVVTQGVTLDEVVENFRDALALHLEDEDLAALGFDAQPRVQVVVELPLAS